jgi:hypothetical protein
MVFTFSALATGFGDRIVQYNGSTDGGLTWIPLGPVPVNTGTEGRSGYATISGTSTGQAVIMSHPEYPQGSPRSIIFIDNSPFEYNFSSYDSYVLSPGYNNNNPPIWPRLVVDGSDNVIFAASQSVNYGTADSMYTNRFDFGTSAFDGWQTWQGDQAETYPLEMSPSGTIGQAYHGETDSPDEGDVFYRESTDGGVTWGASEKIYTHTVLNDTGYGAIRGNAVNFYGEEPCVVFETAWQNFVTNEYRQGWPQELLFWSPNINGGVPKVLVDSSWANYNVGGGPNDVYLGVSRPVLSRSESGDYLFLAFSGSSGVLDPTNDDAPFFDGYFMYSTDGGDTWTDPEKFTPDVTPQLDWRWHSIARISPVSPQDEDAVTVHIIVEADPMAGSQIQGTGSGVTAHYYHFSTEITIVSNDDEIIVNNFNLEQNYPNPFNPSTTINYNLAERSAVTLKVYDVLGNEVASLVNTTQEAGKHSINFNAANLASGLYIYTLNTGNFTSSKKMMLLK